jgi:hypothetical protein
MPEARARSSSASRRAERSTAQTTIDELGLSSLERVELMMALEEALQITVDEAGSRPRDRRRSRAHGASARRALGARSAAAPEPIDFPPGIDRAAPGAAARQPPTWILPLGAVFASIEGRGLEHLDELTDRRSSRQPSEPPGHARHPDALPPRWRYRSAPAMAKEFFKAHFYPEQFGRRRTHQQPQLLPGVPLLQRVSAAAAEAGTRQTLRYIGELLSSGFSVLIFPEGKRSDDGSIGRFLPGVGMAAARLRVPVVPVRLEVSTASCTINGSSRSAGPRGSPSGVHCGWKEPITRTLPGPLKRRFGSSERRTVRPFRSAGCKGRAKVSGIAPIRGSIMLSLRRWSAYMAQSLIERIAIEQG